VYARVSEGAETYRSVDVKKLSNKNKNDKKRKNVTKIKKMFVNVTSS